MAIHSDNNREPMLEIYIFETNQLLEQLEKILLKSEKTYQISKEDINEIFRIMHTIKGSSTMMNFHNIAAVSHALEDLFDLIRKNPDLDYHDVIDVVLSALDFIKAESMKIQNNQETDGDESLLLTDIKNLLNQYAEHINQELTSIKKSTQESFLGINNDDTRNLKHQKYIAKVFFDDGCQMENVRAFSLVFSLKDLCSELYYHPYQIEQDNSTSEWIVENGFELYFSSDISIEVIRKVFEQTLFLKTYELKAVEHYEKEIAHIKKLIRKANRSESEKNTSDETTLEKTKMNHTIKNLHQNVQQSLISVNIKKLDDIMDLVGEIVIAESMVTKNPDLNSLILPNFEKSAGQLKKLLDNLQDHVMSLRMIPVMETFQKMNRIVRDMGKKLNKEVELVIAGEDTEIDKNIINHLSDPLIHLIRNSMDHGIEGAQIREKLGKPKKGTIQLIAKNVGGEVIITVADDGKGLDRNHIYQLARKKGLISKSESELSDSEIFSCILLPGFSTKDTVTEFSGRGVGMDVVKENVEKVGGMVFVDSEYEKGTEITIRIPLTMAIINGMKISVGKTIYTVPTSVIREFFKAEKKDLVCDTQGNEMILYRGDCYPIIRLHQRFGIKNCASDLCDGIMVVIEWDNKAVCLFVDSLVGEQNVVVKPLPRYLSKFIDSKSSISGSTILGDGSISLILDAKNLIKSII